ncbi:response regulator [Streptomyces sp. NPDC028635]|uniref:response regulator n=1 Tax=Streptomyces sp. NPDC028635 TaxID=3154800 RepID=UPI0033C95D86
MPSDAEILIVDEHQGTLYALESTLAPLGYRLGRATSGDAALKQLLRGRVGLLLLQVRTPGAGALDVVRYMRRLEQTQHIPVVLLTGPRPDPDLAAAAFDLRVAGVIGTPVDPWTLRTQVRHLYDTHQHRLALEHEIRRLRARPADGTGSAGPAPLPHPAPRPAAVPHQRDPARPTAPTDPARPPRAVPAHEGTRAPEGT